MDSRDRRRRARTTRAVLAGATALAAGALLSGCGPLVPETGSYLTTVPEAIENSDLDVVRVGVSSYLDGFARDVAVNVDLDRDVVTTDEIEQVLRLVADKIDQPGAARLKLTFWDAPNVTTIESEAQCEAIGSPAIRCSYSSISIPLADLRSEFGAQ